MKNRIKAILLATGLTVSMLCGSAYATDASTEAVTEAATEAAEDTTETATEAAKETELAAAEEEAGEVASELAAEEASADGTADVAASEGKYAAYYDSMEVAVGETLQALSDMTDEQVQAIIENGQNKSETVMAATWDSVREELGKFVGITSQEVTEDKDVITVHSVATYDGVDGAPVNVTYVFDARESTASLKWEVDYPMSKLLEQAGLNTVMGIGIVFLALVFLSFLISQLHWIPDLINKKENEKKAAQAAAPAAVTVPEAEEEELADDLELVAVITAAIAASENTSTDGFVVRSIKKANRRKWQNA